MIKELSNRLTNFLMAKGAVNKEDRDIYLYGSEILISELLCTVITLGIGFSLGRFFKTVLYLIIYTLIRIYAGGYHAMSHKICITIFNISYISFVTVTELIFFWNMSDILCFGTIAAIMIIFILSPVEDPRKPLQEFEFKVYRKKARRRTLFWGLFLICIYLFFPFAKDEMGYGMIAICEVALFVIIGYIKNKIYNYRLMSKIN